jgi:hypothetical protein
LYIIRDYQELLNILVPILENYPLRTTKYFDYLDFKKILLLLNVSKTTVVSDKNKEIVLYTIKGMNTGRINYDIKLIPKKPISKY